MMEKVIKVTCKADPKIGFYERREEKCKECPFLVDIRQPHWMDDYIVCTNPFPKPTKNQTFEIIRTS